MRLMAAGRFNYDPGSFLARDVMQSAVMPQYVVCLRRSGTVIT